MEEPDVMAIKAYFDLTFGRDQDYVTNVGEIEFYI
jgi:hypothetical protein